MRPSRAQARIVFVWLLLLSCGAWAPIEARTPQQTAAANKQDGYAAICRDAADAVRRGDYQTAIRQYEAALRIRPGAPEALNNLAVAYYEAHQYGMAFDTASTIWRTHPELRSAALICGLSAVQCNRASQAIEPLESVLAAEPKNRDALLGLASASLALSKLPEAIELYERETASSPADSQAWYGLAICYEKSAENASRKLAQVPGGAVYSKRLLADYLQSAGDTKLAAEAFGESERLGTDETGEAKSEYEAARDFAEKSRASFERFIALSPDSWQAALFLGDVERQHGRLPAALSYYRKAAKASPDNPAPLLGIGTVQWELGQFEPASSALHRVLELSPQSSQAIFELANIAVRQRREDEAIPLLLHYLALQPDALAARADLGRAYLHRGEYGQAAEELRKAAPSDEQGDIHYQLSTALRKLGRTNEADEAMKDSARIRNERAQRERKVQDAH